MFTKKDIEYVAHLSRINLEKEELEYFTKQLEDILKYIQKLNKVDISKVEPTAHVLPVKNVLRKDTPKKSLPVKEVLQNAPGKDEKFFKVPKVIE
ncbi:Asp-tRNA(Asn)/Glu-tRNA(Gln) amidotransferase subunit GatC [Candidatus Omnitrophota bacterium]